MEYTVDIICNKKTNKYYYSWTSGQHFTYDNDEGRNVKKYALDIIFDISKKEFGVINPKYTINIDNEKETFNLNNSNIVEYYCTIKKK